MDQVAEDVVKTCCLSDEKEFYFGQPIKLDT